MASLMTDVSYKSTDQVKQIHQTVQPPKARALKQMIFRTKTIRLQTYTRPEVDGVGSILSLISKEFVILILIAIVIASPIAYFGVDHWLQEFAYRIKLEWWLFALAGGLVLSTALLIIGARALQAALNNPVKALRTE